MPDVTQYTFKHRELLEILVRKAGVREGRWQLVMNFGFAAGNFGPSDAELSPGAITAVNWVGIQKAASESPAALTVDAAALEDESGPS